MHLRWVFTVETTVILLESIFEFTFNKGSKVLIIKFRCLFLCVPRGLEVKLSHGAPKGPEIHSGQNLDSFLFFFFSFSFRLVFILGITVLLCFYT